MKRILLVTHNFSYTGGPLVLFQLAKCLRDLDGEDTQNGRRPKYHVQVFGYGDGPLLEDYKREGIEVTQGTCSLASIGTKPHY